MTLEEAEGFLFFLRDEMLKRFEYDANQVWAIPEIAFKDPSMGMLVRRWFNTTKPDMRKYIETRILQKVAEHVA